MESVEDIAKLRARVAKAEEFISRLVLLEKLSARVIKDAADLEARLKDAVLIGPREAAMAENKSNRVPKILDR